MLKCFDLKPMLVKPWLLYSIPSLYALKENIPFLKAHHFYTLFSL